VQSEVWVTWTGIGSVGKRRTIVDAFGLLESIVTGLKAEMVAVDAANRLSAELSRRLPWLERPVHFGRNRDRRLPMAQART
jgi:hypothetical protein